MLHQGLIYFSILREKGVAEAKAVASRLREIGQIVGSSSVYRCQGQGQNFSADQNGHDNFDTLDAVVMIESDLGLFEMLAEIQSIRERLLQANNIKDLQLLVYEKEIYITPKATVPHPIMVENPTVLLSCQEVAPEMEHPILKEKIKNVRPIRSTMGNSEFAYQGRVLLEI